MLQNYTFLTSVTFRLVASHSIHTFSQIVFSTLPTQIWQTFRNAFHRDMMILNIQQLFLNKYFNYIYILFLSINIRHHSWQFLFFSSL